LAYVFHDYNLPSILIFAVFELWFIQTVFYLPEGEYWKYCMGQKNGLYMFGYNSAQSEPIWRKSGTLLAKCCGLPLADSWCDSRSSNSLRDSRDFFVMRIAHNFTDFPPDIYDI